MTCGCFLLNDSNTGDASDFGGIVIPNQSQHMSIILRVHITKVSVSENIRLRTGRLSL